MMDDGQLAMGMVAWMVAFLFGQHLQAGLTSLCQRARLAAHPARRPV
jgi:hypothetical protein